MKNGCDEILEAKNAEQSERARKLYRYVSDVARRVSDATAACRSISDLFSTMIEVQRQKLRDNCEKLLFLDPLNHGKKSLELLWRKVYYDTVSAAKKLRESDQEYDNYIFTHIVGGIGHFHHFITRLQTEMKVQFNELDYTPLHSDEDAGVEQLCSEDELQFGRSALHSCLIYLGDLSRYQVEIFHSFDPSIAARYYLQGAHIDMTSGMPYNQLGNLYLDKNYNLDSVCYYIHCLSCVTPFEGALGNLEKIFEKNSQFFETLNEAETLTQTEHIQSAVANFLSLIEIWYLSRDDTNIPQRCSVIAQELKIAMDFTMTPLPDINKNYEEYTQAIEEENINPSYLNGNLIHKIVQICLFTTAKINEIDEQKAFACKAFTLALFSQLLQKLLKQLESLGFRNPAHNYKARTVPIPEMVTEKIEELVVNGKTSPNEVITNGKQASGDEEEVAKCISDDESNKLQNGEAKSASKKALAKRRRRRRVASSESSEVSDAATESSDVDSDGSASLQEHFSDSSYHSDEDSKSDASYDDLSDVDEMKENTDASQDNKKQVISKLENNNTTQHDNNLTENARSETDEPKLDDDKIKNFFLGDNILPSIKLLQDWILTEKNLLLSCGNSGESLFQCVVDLLNIFTYYFHSKSTEVKECNTLQYIKRLVKKLKLEYKTIPLPEDINLRGTNVCKFDKDAAEWQILDRYKPSVYDENVIRVLNFIEFGNQIAKVVPKIRYNKTMKIFYLKKAPHPRAGAKVGHKKTREWHNSMNQRAAGGSEAGAEAADEGAGEAGGALLRRLGRLWLTARVRELERVGAAPAPALLALDAAALHEHLRRVKQLARTRNFILLVPTVVLQELDELKRERSSARDAIRWLEIQLKGGSRFLRAQRPGQAKPLPLLKYPRKAPPHVHNFIQILEFCNHLIADERSAAGDVPARAAPLLVLLVGGEPAPAPDWSAAGAAAAAGIAVEHVCDFYAKWRHSLHKSGKKR